MTMQSAKNELTYYFSLPKIRKSVGIFDHYKNGRVCHIDFNGELYIVWVQFKSICKAFAY